MRNLQVSWDEYGEQTARERIMAACVEYVRLFLEPGADLNLLTHEKLLCVLGISCATRASFDGLYEHKRAIDDYGKKGKQET